uniref:ADP-ribosylation factor-like protein 6-interacting protein 4 n=1 Tax=Monopterus albus TaxID=43700 RepID=A0A3Q3JM89_MONAL|nr:ADP-ribosylation factor-like protein 6-interacting protein 4 [Monopterus albus]
MDRSRSPDRAGREKKHDKKKKRRRSSSSSSSSSPGSRSRSTSLKKAPRKSRDVKTQKKKRKRSSSSSSSSTNSSSSSSSSSSSDEKTKRKKSKAKKKKLKKKKAKLKKQMKKEKKKKEKQKKKAEVLPSAGPAEKRLSHLEVWNEEGAVELGPVMTDEQKARLSTKRPLTKEEYEARQSVIRKVVDPETGRTRLVRGEGEIIEEIVSREKHKDINKQATKGDGNAFQRKLGMNR